MKYAFIVNPVSGQGKHDRGIAADIEELIKGNPNRDIKLYYTRGETDATYLSGLLVYGHDNAVLGVVPVGSGNDFVRQLGINKGSGKRYLNLPEQLDGMVTKMDLIRMSWIEKGEEKTRFITNGINIGFDGNTAILAHSLKRLPLVSGTGSYLMAVAANLAGKKGQKLRITADGKNFHTGKLLLATAANGGFCGGGVQSCPNAARDQGPAEKEVRGAFP